MQYSLLVIFVVLVQFCWGAREDPRAVGPGLTTVTESSFLAFKKQLNYIDTLQEYSGNIIAAYTQNAIDLYFAPGMDQISEIFAVLDAKIATLPPSQCRTNVQNDVDTSVTNVESSWSSCTQAYDTSATNFYSLFTENLHAERIRSLTLLGLTFSGFEEQRGWIRNPNSIIIHLTSLNTERESAWRFVELNLLQQQQALNSNLQITFSQLETCIENVIGNLQQVAAQHATSISNC